MCLVQNLLCKVRDKHPFPFAGTKLHPIFSLAKFFGTKCADLATKAQTKAQTGG